MKVPKLGHDCTMTEARYPTCQIVGTHAYWTCQREGCGLVFADAACTRTTTVADQVIPIIPHDYEQYLNVAGAIPGVSQKCSMCGEMTMLPSPYADGAITFQCAAGTATLTDVALEDFKNGISPETFGKVTCKLKSENDMTTYMMSLHDEGYTILDIFLGKDGLTLTEPAQFTRDCSGEAKIYLVEGNFKTLVNSTCTDGKVTFDVVKGGTYAIEVEEGSSGGFDGCDAVFAAILASGVGALATPMVRRF